MSEVSHNNNVSNDVTLESYLQESGNDKVYTIAQQIISSNKETFQNIYVFYGGVGLGKEILLQGIANKFLELSSDVKLIGLEAETLYNSFLSLGRSSFVEKYNSLEALILDEFQNVFSYSKDFQNTLIESLKYLHDTSQVIIIGADCPPHAMMITDTTLKNLLLSATLIELELPNYEMRVRILTNYKNLHKIDAPQEIINLLAEELPSNLTVLKNTLVQLAKKAELEKKPISTALALDLLENKFNSNLK